MNSVYRVLQHRNIRGRSEAQSSIDADRASRPSRLRLVILGLDQLSPDEIATMLADVAR